MQRDQQTTVDRSRIKLLIGLSSTAAAGLCAGPYGEPPAMMPVPGMKGRDRNDEPTEPLFHPEGSTGGEGGEGGEGGGGGSH